jgi:hypothetical protein
MWSIHTIRHYSGIKNEIILHAVKWMLGEISQAQKAKYYMFFIHVWNHLK